VAKQPGKDGKPERPLWLRMIHDIERAIGGPVESFVRSDAYFDLLTQAKRAHARLAGLHDRLSQEALHTLNLPAETDVRRLREQLSRVERRLNELAKEVADAEEAAREEPRQAKKSSTAEASPKPPRKRSQATRARRPR
jgi:hypothetical protein